MADFVATDVTYTEVAGSARRLCNKVGTRRQFDLVFGDGIITYERDTGLPLSKAKLGCPTEVSVIRFLGRTPNAAASNYVWEWDKSNVSPALNGFEVATGAAGPDGMTEIADDFAIEAQAIRIEVEGY